MRTERLGNLLEQSGSERAGDREFPILSITMKDGLVDQSTKFKKRIASKNTAAYRVVYANELVVGFPIDEGVIGFQTKYPAAIVSPAYGIWRLKQPNETYIPYIERYLRSSVARAFYASKMRGGVARRRSLNRKDFLEIEIPFPTYEEQKRTAVVLEKAHALRRQRQESLALTEKLLQSVFIGMFGDLVRNPRGWKQVLLGKIIKSGPQNGLYRPKNKYGDGYRILRIDGFHGGKIVEEASLKRVKLTSDEAEGYLLAEGDIVINRVNSLKYLGKSAVMPNLTEPTVFESNMMRFSVDQSSILPQFLIAVLQSQHIRDQIAGRAKKAVNQASINQTDVCSFIIPLPPLEYQSEYLRRINVIEAMWFNARSQLEESKNLFHSLQQRAFDGNLDLSRVWLEEGVAQLEAATARLHEVADVTLPSKFGSSQLPDALKPDTRTRLQLSRLDELVKTSEKIPWSTDYLRYRIVSSLKPLFTFEDVMTRATDVFEELRYEEIRDLVFELLGDSEQPPALRQRFDLTVDKDTNQTTGSRRMVFEFTT
jgi:type I restriction enzyme, S subunit